MDLKIAFAASDAEAAQQAQAELTALHGTWDEASADVIVALGGDGFMLQTLQRTQALGLAVYGMNRGTIGFLMNDFSIDTLPQRLACRRREGDRSPCRFGASVRSRSGLILYDAQTCP